MLKATKQFLEDYIYLLNEGRYEDFFNELYQIGDKVYNEVLNIIKGAKINPLPHIKTLPKNYFAFDLDLISYTVPNNINNIDIYAFLNCKNLETIIIPKNVISIWNGAFSRCDSLKNIIYEGTTEEWINNVSVSVMYNQPLIENEVQCSDGNVKYNSDIYRWEPIIE